MFRRIDLPWLTHLSSSPRYYAVKGPWFLISCKLCLLTHHHPLSALTCGKLQSSPGLWICFYSQISDSVCDSSLGKSLFLIISCSELKEKAELFPLMSLPWHFRFTLYPPTTKPRQGRFSASPIWGGGFQGKWGKPYGEPGRAVIEEAYCQRAALNIIFFLSLRPPLRHPHVSPSGIFRGGRLSGGWRDSP